VLPGLLSPTFLISFLDTKNPIINDHGTLAEKKANVDQKNISINIISLMKII
jgi:hypothetical protein